MPSPDDRTYRPALDGLRALAVGGVIVYHLGYPGLPGGFLGVDLFFVLSGYLITGLLLDEYARTGRIGLAGFWARRARRLLPAFLLMLLAVAAAVRYLEPASDWPARRGDMIAALTYWANWHFVITDQSYFAQFAAQSPLRHTWSLAIEEQFYLVWPALVLLLRRHLVAALAAGTAVSAVVMVAVYDPASPTRSYVGTDARAQQLLIGALLAVALRRGLRASPRWAGFSALAGSAAAFALVTDSGRFYYTGGATLVALVFAALIWAAETTGPLARVLSVAPARWLGRISYGLYLWHWPVILFAPAPVRLPLTLALATASFHLVEQPIRRARRLTPPLRVAVGAAVAIVLCGSVSVVATTYATGLQAQQVAAVAKEPCPDTTPICVRIPPRPGRGVVAVVGDSIARSLDPGVVDLARRRGWGYVLAAHNGCGLTGLVNMFEKSPPKPWQRECAEQTPGRIRDVLDRYHPALVISVSRWELIDHVGPDGGPVASLSPRWRADVEAGLRGFARDVTGSGARLAMLAVLPISPSDPACLRDHDRPECVAEPDAPTDATNAIYREVHAAVPGTTLVSVQDEVCPSGHCRPVVDDGLLLRYDGLHFTPAGARWLVRRVEERLAQESRVVPAGVPSSGG